MKSNYYLFLIICISSLFSCLKEVEEIPNNSSEIQLRWFSSYADDNFEKQKIAIAWCLSSLGANIAEQTFIEGIVYKNPIITINIEQLGFDENAVYQLQKLHQIFKDSEEYKVHNAFDLGKYITMTLGSTQHYYKIVNTPKQIEFYTTNYNFNQLKGYVNNSSISLPNIHRIISYSSLEENKKQVYIAKEINPTNQEIKEFETLERMENGQLKFAVYNVDGNLIPSSDTIISNAGKPAKCLWCHEVVIQPLFSPQDDFNNYLTYLQLKDTLNFYNSKLQKYQDNIWQNPTLQNKRLHENMELSYISYMEPSAERLSLEWNITIKKVESLLLNIPTHIHPEFPFLGNLYHRKEVIPFSPFQVILPPTSVREVSDYEPNLLTN